MFAFRDSQLETQTELLMRFYHGLDHRGKQHFVSSILYMMEVRTLHMQSMMIVSLAYITVFAFIVVWLNVDALALTIMVIGLMSVYKNMEVAKNRVDDIERVYSKLNLSEVQNTHIGSQIIDYVEEWNL